MFTHFSDADGCEEYTMEQFSRFLDARDALAGLGHTVPLLHCAASAAAICFPCTHMDMIRPGIALYGYYPDESLEGLVDEDLHPVMSVKARISAVRALPKGTCVSYGRTAVLDRDSRLAVIPMGYGDGLPRLLSNKMSFLIHGVPCPVVGRVCMDMCMVDVTDLPDVVPGDVATIYGGELAQKAADLTGTIVYELLCDVSPRVPRVYLDK
jgi:alanine racemase